MTTVDLWGQPAPEPVPAIKPGRAPRKPLGERQAAKLAAGLHPLSGVGSGWELRLHPDAGSADDLDGPGRRCGSCVHRMRLDLPVGDGYRTKAYTKCTVGWDPEDGGYPTQRVSNSEASDVRAWWPGCVDHETEADVLRRDGGPEELARADELDAEAEAEAARLRRVERARGRDLILGLAEPTDHSEAVIASVGRQLDAAAERVRRDGAL